MLHTISAFDRLGEENAFAVLARATSLAQQGRDIVNLGIGQPDFKTPPHIVEAAIKAKFSMLKAEQHDLVPFPIAGFDFPRPGILSVTALAKTGALRAAEAPTRHDPCDSAAQAANTSTLPRRPYVNQRRSLMTVPPLAANAAGGETCNCTLSRS